MDHPPPGAMSTNGPAAAGEDLATGVQVGRYRIEHLAGRGGMGEVFKAWDTLLERFVALKAIPADVVEDQDARLRFHREAMALAQLNHPHILQVYDVVSVGERTLLALEWVEGTPLDHLPEPLGLEAVLQLWLQAVQALAVAHEKGLVHRDLKPGNLMLDGGGQLKVLDFGLAQVAGIRPEAHGASGGVSGAGSTPGRPLTQVVGADLSTGLFAVSTPTARVSWRDALTAQGTFVGSPRYASPEQMRGQELQASSDIWSLGVTLWELLFRGSPFPGHGLEHMTAVLEARREPMPSGLLPRKLRPLLERMLADDPDQRPTAVTLETALRAYLHPKTTLRWALALVGAVGLTAALGYALFARGVAADLVHERPARLVVLPVENVTGQAEHRVACRWLLPDLLLRNLSAVQRLAPVDSEELQRASQRFRLKSLEGLTPQQVEQVVSAVGAKLYLAGRLERAQGQLQLAFELRDAGGRVRHRQVLRQLSGSGPLLPSLAFEAARAVSKAVDPLGRFPAHPPEVMDEASLTAFGRGMEAFDRGDFKAAEPLFREVAFRYPRQSKAVRLLGRCLARLGTQPSEPLFLWGRMSAQLQGERHEELSCLTAYALRLTERGERAAAMAAYQEALALAEAMGDPDALGSALSAAGILLHQQGQLPEARAHFERALDQFQVSRNRHSMSRLLNNLAVMDKNQGRLDQAEGRYQEALQICLEMKDRWGEAVALNNLGDLAMARGRWPEARLRFQQALELRRAVGDAGGEAYSLVGLGSVAQGLGQLDDARSYQQQALERARSLQLRPMEGLALYNLGEVTRAAGQWAEAIDHYRAAQRLHREIGDDGMVGHALAGEAECMVRRGSGALAAAGRLLREAREKHPEDSAYLLRAEAWTAQAAGDRTAQDLFRRALDQARRQAPELIRELSR